MSYHSYAFVLWIKYVSLTFYELNLDVLLSISKIYFTLTCGFCVFFLWFPTHLWFFFSDEYCAKSIYGKYYGHLAGNQLTLKNCYQRLDSHETQVTFIVQGINLFIWYSSSCTSLFQMFIQYHLKLQFLFTFKLPLKHDSTER